MHFWNKGRSQALCSPPLLAVSAENNQGDGDEGNHTCLIPFIIHNVPYFRDFIGYLMPVKGR